MMPASTISTPKLIENTESSLVRAETSSQTTVSISGVRICAWARSAALEMTASSSIIVIPPRSATPADLRRRTSGWTEARTTSHDSRSPGGSLAAPRSAVMWVTPGSSASSWSTAGVRSGGVTMRRWSMTAVRSQSLGAGDELAACALDPMDAVRVGHHPEGMSTPAPAAAWHDLHPSGGMTFHARAAVSSERRSTVGTLSGTGRVSSDARSARMVAIQRRELVVQLPERCLVTGHEAFADLLVPPRMRGLPLLHPGCSFGFRSGHRPYCQGANSRVSSPTHAGRRSGHPAHRLRHGLRAGRWDQTGAQVGDDDLAAVVDAQASVTVRPGASMVV
jgi:hypothetical protein